MLNSPAKPNHKEFLPMLVSKAVLGSNTSMVRQCLRISAAETEIGGLQGGEAAPAGEKEDTAESGKASETGKIGAPLSWADF